MQSSKSARISKGQVAVRVGAFLFVVTGLFLGALLAALAGI